MGDINPGVGLSPPTPSFGSLQRAPRASAQLLPKSVCVCGELSVWAEVSRKTVNADVTGADLGSYVG